MASKAQNTVLKVAAGVAVAGAALKYIDSRYQVNHDIHLVRKIATGMKQVKDHVEKGSNIVDVWYETMKVAGTDKLSMVMIEDDGSVRKFTFGEMEELSNRIANWMISKSLKKGDTIALFMENRPEYVATWLAAAKIGVKASFINTSIVGKPLAHSIKICKANMIIFNYELAESIRGILDYLKNDFPNGIAVWSQNPFPSKQSNIKQPNNDLTTDFCGCMNAEVLKLSINPPPAELRAGITMTSPFGYIYTSGTTGLPKAAVILHMKMFGFGNSASYVFELRPDDVVLTHLPLFHSAGGGIGVGFMVSRGMTLVLRKKFSASRFFEDAANHGATVAQYIGELCKFLLYSAPSKYDKAHKVRIMIGNGLRPEIWEAFQQRFNLPEIGEFYGATEGNGALVNHCKSAEGRGACGRLGSLLMRLTGARFVKFDVKTDEPMRDKNGRCIDCDVNEPGELFFLIKPNDISSTFAGYESKEATEKKIARNAFVDGDQYFRTGDLLRRDANGYIHFVDRIGDTFRWKGENCSTTEVTEVIQGFDGIFDCNVYGVQIPNNMDGRAPMAALTLSKDNINLKDFANYVSKNLPTYARPLFIRIAAKQLSMTQTLKQQKVELRNEGIDLSLVNKSGDKLYWLSPETNQYEPFGENEFRRVTTPGSRL